MGDAVLGLAVTDHIYQTYPNLPEGQLAKLRASVVNTATLADVAHRLGLGSGLLLGKGEEMSGGRHKESILADGLEAVIGAVFVDGGWGLSESFTLDLLLDIISSGATRPGRSDFKTQLQELSAQLDLGSPTYRIAGTGPDHDRHFTAVAVVNGTAKGEGSGTSKKRAEQSAARAAWLALSPSLLALRHQQQYLNQQRSQIQKDSQNPARKKRAMAQLELPEIETLRRDLERETAGRKIKAVDVKSLKSLPTARTKKAFVDPLIGAKVNVVERHGLFLVAMLNNEHALIIELGEHGRLQRCPSKTKPDSDIVITITFTQGGDLRIADKDGSSKVWVVPMEEFDTVVPPEDERGLDLLVRPLSWIDFGRLVLPQKVALKTLLTDPSIFVGIGAVYSDEILFDAGLRYDRTADSLSMQELRRLYRSVVGILHDAIKYRGVTTESHPFLDLTGTPGDYAEHLAVFDKAGELSPRSRLPIEKAQFKGKTVYFCTTQV